MSLSEEKALFGIGPFELMVIVVGAVVIIGPKKLPQAMKQLGRFFVHARRMTSDVRNSFDTVIKDAETEIRVEEVQKTRELIENARKEVGDSLSDHKDSGASHHDDGHDDHHHDGHDHHHHDHDHADDPNFVHAHELEPSEFRDENAQAYQAPVVQSPEQQHSSQKDDKKKETSHEADPFDRIEHVEDSTEQKS
jgi:Tat protein translocase TatB subunit